MSYFHQGGGSHAYSQHVGAYYTPSSAYYGVGAGTVGASTYYGNTNRDGGSGRFAPYLGIASRWNKARLLLHAHGVLASLAFVVFFPVGAIAIRIIPGRFALFVHAMFQLLAYLFYVVALGIGIYLAREMRFGSFNFMENAHPLLGLVIFAFISVQPILGILHHLGFKKRGRRSFISYLHIWIGRIFVSLGIINGGLGLRLSFNRSAGMIAYAVVAAIFWLLWMIAACFGEFRNLRHRRQRSLEKGNRSQKPLPNRGPHRREIYSGPVAVGRNARGPMIAKPGDTYA